MKNYDFIIAGGGGAGLGLALALLDSRFQHHSILIIDSDTKQKDDRTWCFWGDETTPFTSIARYSWKKLTVRSESFQQNFDLAQDGEPGWKYWMVSGLDFYNHARHQFSKYPNVEFILGDVERIESQQDQATVWVNGEEYTGKWVFNSIIKPGEIKIDPQKQHDLKQHFLGWRIKIQEEFFDPKHMTLFDFETLQKDSLRFFYILPFSKNEAMIEYTIFSAALLTEAEYEEAMRIYIKNNLGIDNYSILFEESGVIPMTDYPFQRKAGKRVMNIGTRGGLVKPSSGYAFKRMQRDAREIVSALEQYDNPFKIRKSPGRYLFYDILLLQILFRQGDKMKNIFSKLFQKNPIMRVFRFLDEDATIWEDISLIASLPPLPFLQALVRVYLMKKI
ncbi:MAG: lycopene cyclase family protein [Anaerolineaceae bacterium]|nr:lycopene cyclase family protein [Anaerolineaceae bacterium]